METTEFKELTKAVAKLLKIKEYCIKNKNKDLEYILKIIESEVN